MVMDRSIRYTGEGMEELEFTEAASNMNDLIVRACGCRLDGGVMGGAEGEGRSSFLHGGRFF